MADVVNRETETNYARVLTRTVAYQLQFYYEEYDGYYRGYTTEEITLSKEEAEAYATNKYRRYVAIDVYKGDNGKLYR